MKTLQFLLFPQCFLLNQINEFPFVHISDIISLFAAELGEPKIGISGNRAGDQNVTMCHPMPCCPHPSVQSCYTELETECHYVPAYALLPPPPVQSCYTELETECHYVPAYALLPPPPCPVLLYRAGDRVSLCASLCPAAPTPLSSPVIHSWRQSVTMYQPMPCCPHRPVQSCYTELETECHYVPAYALLPPPPCPVLLYTAGDRVSLCASLCPAAPTPLSSPVIHSWRQSVTMCQPMPCCPHRPVQSCYTELETECHYVPAYALLPPPPCPVLLYTAGDRVSLCASLCPAAPTPCPVLLYRAGDRVSLCASLCPATPTPLSSLVIQSWRQSVTMYQPLPCCPHPPVQSCYTELETECHYVPAYALPPPPHPPVQSCYTELETECHYVPAYALLPPRPVLLYTAGDKSVTMYQPMPYRPHPPVQSCYTELETECHYVPAYALLPPPPCPVLLYTAGDKSVTMYQPMPYRPHPPVQSCYTELETRVSLCTSLCPAAPPPCPVLLYTAGDRVSLCASLCPAAPPPCPVLLYRAGDRVSLCTSLCPAAPTPLSSPVIQSWRQSVTMYQPMPCCPHPPVQSCYTELETECHYVPAYALLPPPPCPVLLYRAGDRVSLCASLCPATPTPLSSPVIQSWRQSVTMYQPMPYRPHPPVQSCYTQLETECHYVPAYALLPPPPCPVLLYTAGDQSVTMYQPLLCCPLSSPVSNQVLTELKMRGSYSNLNPKSISSLHNSMSWVLIRIVSLRHWQNDDFVFEVSKPQNTIGYGRPKNSGDQSRAILACLFPFPTLFSTLPKKILLFSSHKCFYFGQIEFYIMW